MITLQESGNSDALFLAICEKKGSKDSLYIGHKSCDLRHCDANDSLRDLDSTFLCTTMLRALSASLTEAQGKK